MILNNIACDRHSSHRPDSLWITIFLTGVSRVMQIHKASFKCSNSISLSQPIRNLCRIQRPPIHFESSAHATQDFDHLSFFCVADYNLVDWMVRGDHRYAL